MPFRLILEGRVGGWPGVVPRRESALTGLTLTIDGVVIGRIMPNL